MILVDNETEVDFLSNNATTITKLCPGVLS
jgi:hypothetical protein